MPDPGMRAAHSAGAGVADAAHEEERNAVRREPAVGADDLARRSAQPELAVALLVGAFDEKRPWQRFETGQLLAGEAQGEAEVGTGVGVDSPDRSPASRDEARQRTGDRALTGAALAGHGDPADRLDFQVFQSRFLLPGRVAPPPTVQTRPYPKQRLCGEQLPDAFDRGVHRRLDRG